MGFCYSLQLYRHKNIKPNNKRNISSKKVNTSLRSTEQVGHNLTSEDRRFLESLGLKLKK